MLKSLKKGTPRGSQRAVVLDSLSESIRCLFDDGVSDHFGVVCTVTLTEAREKQLRRRQRCSGEPLRMGARARVFQCVALNELLC